MMRHLFRLLAVASLSLGAACVDSGRDLGPDPDPGPEPDPDPIAEPGVWGTAQPLHDLPGSSQLQRLLVDSTGHAMAMWQQTHPTPPYNRLWASRMIADAWEAPIMVTAEGNLGSELAVAGDVTSARAAWLQSAGTERRIVTVDADASGAWSPVTELRSALWDQGTLSGPRLAADDEHAVIVWGFYDPATRRTTIEARIRKGAADWSPLLYVASGIDLASYNRPLYDLAFDAAGAIVVTWVERQPDRLELWARRGLPSQGSLTIAWETPQRVTSAAADPHSYAIRELWIGLHAGRSFAGWLVADSDGTQAVVTSHRRSDGTWEAEQATPGIASEHYAEPRFVAGPSGHKVILWREPLAESSRVLARRFDPERGWQETAVVADGLKAPYLGCIDIDAHYFDVSVDADGNALAVWEERLDEQLQGRSRMAIWSSQFLAGAGWQAPLRVDADEGQASLPVVAVGPGGTAIALFSAQGADGTASLATNRLAPPAP